VRLLTSRPFLLAVLASAACVPLHGDVADVTADFYVDPVATAGSGRFKTITDAIAAANASTAPAKTIHVAAGTYGNGETFPLILRDGTSLIGEGTDKSILSGGGPTGAVGATSFAPDISPIVTLLVGDPVKTTRIADLALKGDQTVGSQGIACDHGVTGVAGPTTPNTILDNVSIDGFQIGARVTYAMLPELSGCSMLVTRSTFRNGKFGVYADGALAREGSDLQVTQRVSVKVGDRTGDASKNTFTGFRITNATKIGALFDGQIYNGAGIFVSDGVTDAAVIGNDFSGSDLGVRVDVAYAPDSTGGMDIENNAFTQLSNSGVVLWGTVLVDELSTNTFKEIHTDYDFKTDGYPGFSAVALVVDDKANHENIYPTIRHARNNVIAGNDAGVAIRSTSTVGGTRTATLNFGTANDPGHNTFQCNSRPTDAYKISGGWDVAVAFSVPQPVKLLFEGNTWDHKPPHSPTLLDAPDPGIDLMLTNAQGLDTANANAGAACSSPFVP
jgi:hypothetical protein